MPIRYWDGRKEIVVVDTTGLDPEDALDLIRDVKRERDQAKRTRLERRDPIVKLEMHDADAVQD